MSIRSRASVTLAALVAPSLCLAQGVATDSMLEPVVVTGQRIGLSPTLPSTTWSLAAPELANQVVINPSDILRWAPNLAVRKRYVGDRNALIAGRSSGSNMAPRGLVLQDGLLLSNFLGRFNAPRWNMVVPQEIETVDVLYGPFSALYPGNSIGTTIVLTTRIPEGLETGADLQYFTQRFREYGVRETYEGRQASGYVGWGGDRASVSLALNRLDNESQPQQYLTFTAPSPGPGGVPVTGAFQDVDPRGLPRVVLGANNGAVEDTGQTNARLRGTARLAADWALDGIVGWWENDYTRTNATFLRDAAGQAVWSGPVLVDGLRYVVGNAAFAPQRGREQHRSYGLALKRNAPSGWNGSLQWSRYDIATDTLRTAALPEPSAVAGGAGTLTDGAGTGWQTLEVQATWTPETEIGHRLAFGVHRNEYDLENRVYALANWLERDSRGPATTQEYFGRTELTAVYAQDAWRLAAPFVVTLGARWERWRATDGFQRFAGLAPIEYADRSITRTSPKASVAWLADDATTLRLSLGRGNRFPTVAELFQGTRVGNNVVVSDPNLQPERSDAVDLTLDRRLPFGTVRASVFQDDVDDAIFSQTNVAAGITTTFTQNVGRVRTRGVELAGRSAGWLARNLSLDASVAFNRPEILENPTLPAAVGKYWVRVPRVRAKLAATYEWTPTLTTQIGWRHTGRQYNELDNSDVNPDVYNGASRANVIDAKIAWRPLPAWEFALGIDNLTSEQYWEAHPFPQRMWVGEVRWRGGR